MNTMYKELVECLQNCAEWDHNGCAVNCRFGKEHPLNYGCISAMLSEAAVAVEELSARVDSLQVFADNISKLPDCNTCLKKNLCEFVLKWGEYCRINCPAWLGEPEQPKEDKN